MVSLNVKSLFLLFVFSMLLVAGTARAKVITNCGASSGYVAYLKNGNLGPQGNFTKDGFRGSKIVLEAAQNPDTGKTIVDVIFFNSGKPYRASKDGKVFLMNYNPTNNTWMILATAKTYLDTYVFNLDKSGQGEVVWTNSRSGGTPKVVLMRAKCG